MSIKDRDESVDLTIDPTSTKNVTLTIVIGNAQIGGNYIIFENDPGTIVAKGDVSNLDLGNGAALIGKTLVVTTNILDSNTSTNKVVATYNFQSCTPAISSFNDTVDNPGDIFSLMVSFNFK